MKIDGKVAIVVGSARGIGRAYCEALLAKGAKVVVADIQGELGTKTTGELCQKYGEGSAIFKQCDNTKDEDIKAIFTTTLGVPDIFIHNAAIIHEFEWQRCLDVNVGGLIRSCLEALKHMSLKNGGGGGVIVNTASISGLRPEVWGPVYSATKWAGVGFTLSWGLPENVAMTGVRFNCICPTTVDTEFVKFVNPEQVYHAEERSSLNDAEDKLTPAYVAEGMVKFVEDDSLSGRALQITTARGHELAKFYKPPQQ